MSDAPAPGPEVNQAEDLWRGITTEDWWVTDEGRPSSAAFKVFPDFSVDIASIAKTPEYTLAHLPEGSGLAAFNYGDAKKLGYIARKEADPLDPGNLAHANVYPPAASRRTAARALAARCAVLRVPSFV